MNILISLDERRLKSQDSAEINWVTQTVGRSFIMTILDQPVFWLFGVIYKVLINIATAEIFSNATISAIYSRLQVIIGVFMLFQLSVSFMKGIIEPEEFEDKQKGYSGLIKRIIFSLILLALIIPINLNLSTKDDSLRVRINNEGILFGTLNELQYRVLNNNTIPKLILGTSGGTTDGSNINDAGDKMAISVYKAFFRVNTYDISKDGETEIHTYDTCNEYDAEGASGASKYRDDFYMSEPNGMNKDVAKQINKYRGFDENGNPGEALVFGDFIHMSQYTCKNGWAFTSHWGENAYAFAYLPIVPFLVGIVFIVLFASYTIEIAVRTIKLAMLRIIAPIPIIAYMSPKGGMDGTFGKWWKLLLQTYLDLFIRLSCFYFVIMIITEMINHGIMLEESNSLVGVISTILIWIGLLLFAKQAPKFLEEALGIKLPEGGALAGFRDVAGLAKDAAAAVTTAGNIARAIPKIPGDIKKAATDGANMLKNGFNQLKGKKFAEAIAAGKDAYANKVANKHMNNLGEGKLNTLRRRAETADSVGRAGEEAYNKAIAEGYTHEQAEASKNRAIKKAADKNYKKLLKDERKDAYDKAFASKRAKSAGVRGAVKNAGLGVGKIAGGAGLTAGGIGHAVGKTPGRALKGMIDAKPGEELQGAAKALTKGHAVDQYRKDIEATSDEVAASYLHQALFGEGLSEKYKRTGTVPGMQGEALIKIREDIEKSAAVVARNIQEFTFTDGSGRDNTLYDFNMRHFNNWAAKIPEDAKPDQEFEYTWRDSEYRDDMTPEQKATHTHHAMLTPNMISNSKYPLTFTGASQMMEAIADFRELNEDDEAFKDKYGYSFNDKYGSKYNDIGDNLEKASILYGEEKLMGLFREGRTTVKSEGSTLTSTAGMYKGKSDRAAQIDSTTNGNN